MGSVSRASASLTPRPPRPKRHPHLPGPPTQNWGLFRAQIPSSCSGAESQARREEGGCWVHPSHGSTTLCPSELPDPASGQCLEPPPPNAADRGAGGAQPSAQPQAPGPKPRLRGQAGTSAFPRLSARTSTAHGQEASFPPTKDAVCSPGFARSSRRQARAVCPVPLEQTRLLRAVFQPPAPPPPTNPTKNQASILPAHLAGGGVPSPQPPREPG